MPIFEIREARFNYRDGQTALDGVSLDIGTGEAVSIIGANGSGKSTLLFMMQGLLSPFSGSVSIFGTKKPGAQERARIALLFQNSQAGLFSLTVWDELLFGPLQMGLALAEAARRAEDVMRMLGINHLRERPPWRLSRGEMKKVALGTCLSVNPEVYLLDEPTAGLDPRSQVEIVELIMALREAGKTIITATHDLHIIEDISERTIILGEDHRILMESNPTRALAETETLLRANLIHEHAHKHGRIVHEHIHYGAHGHEGHGPQPGHEPRPPEAQVSPPVEAPQAVGALAPQAAGALASIAKLKIMAGHWREHNAGHVEEYEKWAQRAEAAGRPELALLLRDIAKGSTALDALFEKLSELIGPA